MELNFCIPVPAENTCLFYSSQTGFKYLSFPGENPRKMLLQYRVGKNVDWYFTE